MTIKIAVDESGTITLEDLIDQLESCDFDPSDHDSLRSAAPYLKALANNRSFLGDYVIELLEQDLASVGLDNNYVPQVILLKLDRQRNYMIRANFWPAENDFVYKSSGGSAFSYGLAHDHNFSFLTAGYFGPGYETDLYEYDYASVSGYEGESVRLTHLGREHLNVGDVMLYRAHRDIHIQHPPEQMSISLNLMESNRKATTKNQYEFDIPNSSIRKILNDNRLQALIYSAALIEPEKSEQILIDLSHKYPNERIRFEAIKARASVCPDYESSIEVISEGMQSKSRMIRESCRLYRTQIDRTMQQNLS